MVQSHAFLSFLQIFCQIIPFFTSPAPTNPWVCRRFPVAVLLQHFNLGALAYVDSYQLQLFLGTSYLLVHNSPLMMNPSRHRPKLQALEYVMLFRPRFLQPHIYDTVNLVGSLEHFLFSHILGIIIIPTDQLHHFSEG
jgi:hypothetical protein